MDWFSERGVIKGIPEDAVLKIGFVNLKKVNSQKEGAPALNS